MAGLLLAKSDSSLGVQIDTFVIFARNLNTGFLHSLGWLMVDRTFGGKKSADAKEAGKSQPNHGLHIKSSHYQSSEQDSCQNQPKSHPCS